jgi:hypothetical protein
VTFTSLEEMLAWREPTNFSHPFRGQSKVIDFCEHNQQWEIVPGDWLSLVDRHDRGFISDNHSEWVRLLRDYPEHVRDERIRLKQRLVENKKDDLCIRV